MTERTNPVELLEVGLGEACVIDPAAGPIAGRAEGPAEGERDVLLYINLWCGDCRRAVNFLEEFAIPYRTIDIEQDEDAAQIVEALNRGSRSVPTILVDGEHVATEPSRAELARIFEVEDAGSGGSILSRLRRV